MPFWGVLGVLVRLVRLFSPRIKKATIKIVAFLISKVAAHFCAAWVVYAAFRFAGAFTCCDNVASKLSRIAGGSVPALYAALISAAHFSKSCAVVGSSVTGLLFCANNFVRVASASALLASASALASIIAW